MDTAVLWIVGRMVLAAAVAADPDGADTDRWRGKVEAVVDGDTLRVRDDGNRLHKVRILGIDAPENGQPFFAAARDHLGKVTRDREVDVAPTGTDAQGRSVARVSMNGNDLAIDMLGVGLAWFYRADTDNPALEAEERKARARSLGLWNEKNPIAPWDWREAERVRMKARKRPRPTAEPEPPGQPGGERPQGPR